MNLSARRPGDGRSGSTAALLVVAVGCAVVLAIAGWSRLVGEAASTTGEVPRTAFSIMQMNVCLSGMAGCYDKAAYPAGVREAVARIREVRPDAVTLSEACRGDAETIAERTGYHLRFARVIYAGAELPCIDPGGRGLFGDAVLTEAPVVAATGRAFEAQSGLEERRWLCVTTRRDQDVCTTHLSTRRSPGSVATNDAQCAELSALLARRTAVRPVVFGGDMNRRGSCAPDGVWTRTDISADQSPGLQHVYGSRASLRSPQARVLPADHSDHDLLLVRADPRRR